MRFWLPLTLLLLFSAPGAVLAQAAADGVPIEFTDAAEAERFHVLAEELRCVKCQNQSLADSNAGIAQDLRKEVLRLMRQGKSDAEIKAYLVARYGEFVLYRPQLAASTWLLWFGPALVLVMGGVVVGRIVRRRNRQAAATLPAATEDEQEW